MLNLLLKYAADHGLVVEPGFAPKSVRWAISCDAEGRFLGVIALADGSRPRDRGRAFARCPDLSQPELVGGSEPRSHFLIESAQVVCLLGAEPGDARVEGKHRFFVRLLREASSAMPELAAAAAMLEDEAALARIRKELTTRKARPVDSVTLLIGDVFPVEREDWHEWWRGFRRTLAAPSERDATMRCFVTGELVAPARTHPKIRGLGGQPSGDALVCFDKAAFQSYGLAQSANAAMSEDTAAAYAAALNKLVAEHSQRLAGATVVHWFAADVAEEDDPIRQCLVGDEATLREGEELSAQQRARELLRSIRTGQRVTLGTNRYYAVTLSGMAGRVMVRDWMEGQFEDLVESVCQWFDDLEIVRLDGQGTARTPGLERVITCLLPERGGRNYNDWIKQVGSERVALWRAALDSNQPLPHSVLGRLVPLNARFHQSQQLERALGREAPPRERAEALSVLYARMALLKAYHRRRDKGGPPIMPELNEDHPHPAYHCGRLMAVYAALQHAAQGDVGAGVVQRYYAAASATPGLILGRLSRLSTFHLNKLDPGLAHWFEGKLADIWARIEDKPPTTLTLEEQSLFALGYYQQMAADRRGRPVTQDQNEKTEEG